MATQIEVHWTEPAEADIRNIVSFIRQESPQAARKLIKQIRHSVSLLSELSAMGKSFNLVEPAAREIVCSHYRIFYDYLPNQNKVLVLAVFDSRQDPSKIYSILARTPRG